MNDLFLLMAEIDEKYDVRLKAKANPGGHHFGIPVHGFTDSDLDGYPQLDDDIRDYLKDHDGSRAAIVGHHGVPRLYERLYDARRDR